MVKNKMIYNGLCCKVNTKAAFVDMYMEYICRYDDAGYVRGGMRGQALSGR